MSTQARGPRDPSQQGDPSTAGSRAGERSDAGEPIEGKGGGQGGEQRSENAGGMGEGDRPLDPLVELLLPTVIHRLGNATQLLTGLNGLLALGGVDGMALVASRGPDMERAGGQASRVGYALGVLGSAQGSELLLARREAKGLEWLVDLLIEALRRKGVVLAAVKVPELAPGAGDGWRSPWAIVRVLLAAAMGAHPEGEAVEWTLDPEAEVWRLRVAEPDPDAWERLRADLARCAPELRLVDAPDYGCLLPLDWLRL